MERQLGFNLDKHFCSRCLKAGYYKMGLGNLLYHPNDGFTAPCVIEFEFVDDTENKETDNGEENKTEDDRHRA